MEFYRNQNFIRCLAITIVLLAKSSFSSGQKPIDSILNKLDVAKYSSSVENKVDELESALVKKTQKTLHHLERLEKKIYERALNSKDSTIISSMLSDFQSRYDFFEQKLENPPVNIPVQFRKYIPNLDTLKTSFDFIDKNISGVELKNTLGKISDLENRIQQAEEIKKFISQREKLIKQFQDKLGIARELKQFNKRAYYYTSQLREYKELLNDRKKIESKAISLLRNTQQFQEFIKKNGMLASLFKLPGDGDGSFSQIDVSGLQTRANVNGLIQQQFGSSDAQSILKKNIQGAKDELQKLKSKVGQATSGSSNDILPDGYEPNTQKSKGFMKRLEYGMNIQTQRGNAFFPVTSDLGLSLGYRLNDKNTIGISAAYKLGLGSAWNNISFTNEGTSLRSFFDIKLKGSFWISNGFEMNYRKELHQFGNIDSWQKSGLLGISKVLSVKSKLLKKTKIQLYWDYLSYSQVPRTQAIFFRFGYTFN